MSACGHGQCIGERRAAAIRAGSHRKVMVAADGACVPVPHPANDFFRRGAVIDEVPQHEQPVVRFINRFQGVDVGVNIGEDQVTHETKLRYVPPSSQLVARRAPGDAPCIDFLDSIGDTGENNNQVLEFTSNRSLLGADDSYKGFLLEDASGLPHVC